MEAVEWALRIIQEHGWPTAMSAVLAVMWFRCTKTRDEQEKRLREIAEAATKTMSVFLDRYGR